MDDARLLTPHERGLSMAARVHMSVERHLGEEAAERTRQAVITALRARHSLHPKDVRYLHPGRTVLILLDDAEERDEAVLIAGALLETYHAPLAPVDLRSFAQDADSPDDPAAQVLGVRRRVMDLLARIPVPSGAEDDDALREALVSADAAARTAALVERLDHARHLHLYPRAEWEPLFEQTGGVYLPVAQWQGGQIAARYQRWAGAFARRLEREARRSGLPPDP